MIATLADFVIWCAEDEPGEDVELSPQMQEFVDESLKRIEEKKSILIHARGANLRIVTRNEFFARSSLVSNSSTSIQTTNP